MSVSTEDDSKIVKPRPRAIATWPFSKPGVQACAESIMQGSSALDAVVDGVLVVELDPTVTSVGYGGLPNSKGELELDAAIMTGDGRVGAVAALSTCKAAAPVAKLVLEKSRHSMLAGAGAMEFARQHGLGACEGDNLLSPHALKRLDEFRRAPESKRRQEDDSDSEQSLHTDTVGMICIDKNGDIAACCATSGMQFKDPGRVGDAPLIGAGLYADGEVGAAVASGDGDQMMRYCLSYHVIERMRHGESPMAACNNAIRRVRDSDPECQAAVCAMHARTGEIGAACTRHGFKIVEWDSGKGSGEDPTLTSIAGPSDGPTWKHTCV